MSKTVLITGASHGIGKATARLFCENGFNVVINYNQSEESAFLLEKELRETGNALAIKADVSKKEQVDAMFQKAKEQFGDVTVLVNNAAVSSIQVMQDITEVEWDRTFGVNVKGMYLCAQAVIPDMIKNKSGHIINISSIWGLTGASCEVHYSASKAAVIGFTKALAKELAPSNICVNCVAPGVVKTAMNRHLSQVDKELLTQEIPLGRLAGADEIAEWIHFLASKGGTYMTGQVISPNGGIVI